MCINTVESTEGAIASYIYFNKEIGFAKQSIYYIVQDESQSRTVAPIENYDSSDFDMVGWYYETIERKEAGWIRPFYYQPYEAKVISYTIPLFNQQGTLVAVIGMDMDVAYFQNLTAAMHLYESGYGFLICGDGEVLYHPLHKEGLSYDSMPKEYLDAVGAILANAKEGKSGVRELEDGRIWFTYTRLVNGLYLGAVVPEAEVLHPMYVIGHRGIVAAVVGVLLGFLFCALVLRQMTKPLKELTNAAEAMARGDLNTPITYAGSDEFGRLASAFRMMKAKMQESISNMSSLAYTDVMTGVNNKAAYSRDAKGMFDVCRANGERFAMIVVDVNNLKKVNDSYGHQVGDELIKGVATSLVKIFGKRNTYRVGGDEFCVLLRNCYEAKVEDDLMRFRNEFFLFSESHRSLFHEEVTAAVGYAFYDLLTDTSAQDVYQKADAIMYENKHTIKETLKNKV